MAETTESKSLSQSAAKVTKRQARTLSQQEAKLFDSITRGSYEEVSSLLSEGVGVDCQDEHGMTPLQHAAYKSNVELCRLFLSHGADVNANAHDHGYTALMFAALSGSKETARVLLEHGANSGMENSVHRTATQMAAFVGQHDVVSLINNFFSREQLEYYTIPQGFETEPKLPSELVTPLYKYILVVNLNPVRLSLYLQSTPELLDQTNKVGKVIDLLCEKMIKQRNTNEVMAVKFHYLGFVLRKADKSNREKNDGLNSWLKQLLMVRDSDGVSEVQDWLIRSMIREFPYLECQLIQQMIRTLSDTTGMFGNISAASVLTGSINGQRFAAPDERACTTCGELNAKICAVCKSVFYCNKQCQKLHWFVHKKYCKQLAEKYEREEKKRKATEEKQRQEEAAIASESSNQNKLVGDKIECVDDTCTTVSETNHTVTERGDTVGAENGECRDEKCKSEEGVDVGDKSSVQS